MNNQTTPSRFSEKAFRQYEGAIRKVIERWPKITLFKPALDNQSVETFTHRLRDVFVAVNNNFNQSSGNWLMDVHIQKWEQVFNDCVVSDTASGDSGIVAVGPRDELRKLKKAGTVVTKADVLELVGQLDLSEVSFLTALKQHIPSPVMFQTRTPLSSAAINDIQELYPVSVTQLNENTYVLT